jgi:hypothetical protein
MKHTVDQSMEEGSILTLSLPRPFLFFPSTRSRYLSYAKYRASIRKRHLTTLNSLSLWQMVLYKSLAHKESFLGSVN